MKMQRLQQLEAGETIDLRADGKAGSGLVMVLQVFAEAVSLEGTYQVQEWPLFSSARKGANVRGFLRIRRGPIHLTCQIERPHVAILLTEKTGEELDFSSGMEQGCFIVNSSKSPEAVAEKFQLRGEIFTVPGNRLGEKYLGRPLPNISLLAALQKALPLVSIQQLLQALWAHGEKRRLPAKVIQANQDCLIASLQEVQWKEITGAASKHPLPHFSGYADYPTGAQSALRTSLGNKTANYAPAGRRLIFKDPTNRCNGCSLCIVNCPEGIIHYVPDEQQGVRVTGANIDQFCKLCRECIEVCPVNLFQETGVEES